MDIDAINDPMEKAAIVAQIKEFGQTPKQLFTLPHPQRLPKVFIFYFLFLIFYFYFNILFIYYLFSIYYYFKN